MRLTSDRNSVRQLSSRRVEHVHLVVVATRYPQLLSVGGDIAHVRTSTAGDWPRRDHFVRRGIEHADRAGSVTPAGDRIPAAIRHVEILPVPARINSVRALSSRNETD